MYDLFPEEPIEPEAAETEDDIVGAARPRRINRVAIAALIAVPAIAIGVAVGNKSSGDGVQTSASSSARTTVAGGTNSGNGTAKAPTITGVAPAGGDDDGGGGDDGGGLDRRGPNSGKIAAVGDHSITLQRAAGNGGAGQTTILTIDATTKYTISVPLPATGLKPGDAVSVLGQRNTATTAIAFAVVVNPQSGGAPAGPQRGGDDGDRAPIIGTIDSISGDTMNVKTSSGTVAVTLASTTSITTLQPATAADIKVGLYVTSVESTVVNGPVVHITLSTSPALRQ